MKDISNTASEKGSINRSMELILQQIGQDKNMFHVFCVQLDMQMRYYLREGSTIWKVPSICQIVSRIFLYILLWCVCKWNLTWNLFRDYLTIHFLFILGFLQTKLYCLNLINKSIFCKRKWNERSNTILETFNYYTL